MLSGWTDARRPQRHRQEPRLHLHRNIVCRRQVAMLMSSCSASRFPAIQFTRSGRCCLHCRANGRSQTRKLRDLCAKLHALMQDEQPGLIVWRILLHDTIVELAQYSGDPVLLSAPDVRAALEETLTGAEVASLWRRHSLRRSERAEAAIVPLRGSCQIERRSSGRRRACREVGMGPRRRMGARSGHRSLLANPGQARR